MPEYHFSLHLSADEILDYYSGAARDVVVVSREGLTVRFAASNLKPHVTHHGVHGEFRLVCGEDFKFIGLDRVSD